MPPLMNTSRRVTMYVPMMPQAILAKRLPSNACWKNVYCRMSRSSIVWGNQDLGTGCARRSSTMRMISSFTPSGKETPRSCRLRTQPGTSSGRIV